MTHAHYNRGDETYYCDVDACGLPFRRLEQIRDHLKTVHNVKRATVENAALDRRWAEPSVPHALGVVLDAHSGDTPDVMA
jgi:hypothetical protein